MVPVSTARARRSRDACKRLNRRNVGIRVSLDIMVDMVSAKDGAQAKAEVEKRKGAAVSRSILL